MLCRTQSVLFEFIDGADFNKEISRSSLIDLNAKKRTTRIYCSVEILAKKMEVALGLAYQRSGILIKNASNLIWNGSGIILPFGKKS